MAKAKITVNGYGTIGKRVADAIRAQDDMEVVGVSKTKPNYEAAVAHQLGYDIYAPAENLGAFEKAGMPAAGTIEEMLEKSDLVTDCTPGGLGEGNKPLYEKIGVKVIWQGGESHPLAGFSFNAASNYEQALGRDLVRVVSCNTTGLCRAITPIDRELGVKKVRVTIARRAADPNDVKKGPINAIVLDPVKQHSHHGLTEKSITEKVSNKIEGMEANQDFLAMYRKTTTHETVDRGGIEKLCVVGCCASSIETNSSHIMINNYTTWVGDVRNTRVRIDQSPHEFLLDKEELVTRSILVLYKAKQTAVEVM